MAVVIRHLRRRIIPASKHSIIWPSCEYHLDSHPAICRQQRGLSSLVRSHQIAPASGGSSLVTRLIDPTKTHLSPIVRSTREAGMSFSSSPPSECRPMPDSPSAATGKEEASSSTESSEQAVVAQISEADSCRTDGGVSQAGPQVGAKSQAEEISGGIGDTDEVPWIDVTLEPPSPSLGKVFMDSIRQLQLPLYLYTHRMLFEKSFNVEEFLEGSKVAYSVVHELFGKGDFEGLETLVSPSLLTTLKSVHEKMVSNIEEKGHELAEYEVDTVPDTRMLNWDMLMQSGPSYNYGLDKMDQREDHDEELYFVFEIAVAATLRVVKKNKAGKVVERVKLRGTHTVKFARQAPLIKKFLDPVDEVKSPWIVLEMSEFGAEKGV